MPHTVCMVLHILYGVKYIYPTLRTLSGITLCYSDLTEVGEKDSQTLPHLLPLALKTISDADLVIVIAGDDGLPSPAAGAQR